MLIDSNMIRSSDTKGKKPVVLVDPSSPYELTNAYGDVGKEIDVRDCESLGVYVEIDINSSTNCRIKALGKSKSELQSAIELANDIRDKLNAHYNDYGTGTEEHDALETLITQAYAKDLGSLQDLTEALLDSYDDHDDDAEQAVPTVHVAQEAGDHSLASTAKPTTLAECHTRLEDLRTKVNAHVADGTAHENGDSTTITISGDKEYYLPIRTVSASDVKVEDEYIEFNVDADQNAILEIDTNKVVNFIQLQAQDSNNSDGQLESVYLVFNKG